MGIALVKNPAGVGSATGVVILIEKAARSLAQLF